jgi:hypothetical protein
LLYSNRTLASTLFLEEILELAKRNEHMRTIFSITNEKLPDGVDNMSNQRFTPEIMREFIGHTYGKTFFICGPIGFMEAMKENLRRIGVHDFQIETEGFSMIPDDGWFVKLRNTAYALGFAAAVFSLPFYFIHKAGNSVTAQSTSSSPATVASPSAPPPLSATSSVSPSIAPTPSAAKTAPVAPVPARKTRTS